MADKRPWLATESGNTYVTGGSPDPKVTLSGTATSLSGYSTRTFAEAATDSNTDFADTNTCTVLVVDEADADTWEMWESAVWNDDTTDYLDLSSATKIGQGPSGALSNSDTVTVYAQFPKDILSLIGGDDDILLFGVACSDETTDLTTGEKVAFDIPFSCVLERIYVSVKTAAAGANLEVDVEDEGTRLLNAVFGFQTNNSETSTFASAAASYTLTKGDLLSIDVDQIGSTTAGAGLKVFFFGYRT